MPTPDAESSDNARVLAQIASVLMQKASASPAERKIDSALRLPADRSPYGSAVPSGIGGATRQELWRSGSIVHIYVKVDSTSPVNVAALGAAGFLVETVSDSFGLFQGWAAETSIEILAGLSFVKSIDPRYRRRFAWER